MTIKIKEEEYKLKYTLRALFIYEQITGKAFSIDKTVEQYLYLYCLLLANNPEMKLTFDGFIQCCDDDPRVMKDLQEYLTAEVKRQNYIMGTATKEDKDLKKN